MPNKNFGERWIALLKALAGSLQSGKRSKETWPRRTYEINHNPVNQYLEQGLKRLSSTNPRLSAVVQETYIRPSGPRRNKFDVVRAFAFDDRFSVPERIEIVTALGKPDEEATEQEKEEKEEA